jgi:carboxypeptidase Q
LAPHRLFKKLFGMFVRFPLFIALLFHCAFVSAQDSTLTVSDRFIKIGIDDSRVMNLASDICDKLGPRLTGSSAMQTAQQWAVQELNAMGLTNVNKEEWGYFGRGWKLENFSMHAETPGYWPVLAYPKAWSPSVKGRIKGEVIYLQANKEEDLLAYKGKLKNKFVLLDTIRDLKEWFDPMAKRYTPEDLLEYANAGPPNPRPRRDWRQTGGLSFNRILWNFLNEEKPLCIVDRSFKGDLGTVFVSGARLGGQEGVRPQDTSAVVLPQVTMSVEHYNRLMRLLQKGVVPVLSMELTTRYELPNKGLEYNVVGDIAGTDLADEFVYFGAHFDSWHAGTGATDNGAGSAVMMEAARILMEYMKQTGEKPRRTLRIALWSGEEQGLYGSINYIRKHVMDTEPGGWVPKAFKPMQSKISAYYNLDNGTGKIRGIYLQGNEETRPIFREWLEPFKEMGAQTISISNTGGTDHMAFDAAGVPGFQFIQEPMAYFNRTHHSNMDNWDHLVADDMKQAATIVAYLVWQTANRDTMLPRKEVKIESAASDSN